MVVKKYYHTQREVATVINEIVDEYWTDNLTDEQLEENLKIVYENNQDKMIRENDYKTILKQRLAVVSKITK